MQVKFSSLPKTDDLDVAVESWLKEIQKTELAKERLARQVSLVQTSHSQLQAIKNLVRENTRLISLPVSLKKYQAGEQALQNYELDLLRLEGLYSNFLALLDQLTSLEENLVDLREDVDFRKGELNGLARELQGLSRLIKELQELRELAEFKEVQAEIERVLARIREIPQEVRQKSLRQGELQGRQTSLGEVLEKDRQELKYLKESLTKKELEFKAELELGFVLQDKSADFREALAFLKRDKGLEHDEKILTRRLQEAVYEERTDLLDFGITIGELAANQVELNRRLGVTARLEGRVVSLYQLSNWLETEIENNELLLDEADRELFEEIIMQTVGQKIRAKIYRAEDWVKNMNKLMAERDTTSGLTFSLQWRPKPAETEAELGTKELVDILKTDVSILSEDIFNQVTGHFRSQVDRAKLRLEEHDFRQSFHETIRTVLDYRNWFEFKLFFQKEGETRKELTNRAFDRLSGGEKAMAMYIPLFSSVYSRYEAARSDAPRLISLDEAFAGVDDSNIRDMFQLMEQLDFHYIINSQILWGDYDTVSNLSICELVRPKNADYVSVIRYLWDGKYRSLVLDDLVSEDLAHQLN